MTLNVSIAHTRLELAKMRDSRGHDCGTNINPKLGQGWVGFKTETSIIGKNRTETET